MSIGDQFGEEVWMRQNTSDGTGITVGEWPHCVEGVRDLACPGPDGFEHLLERRVGVSDRCDDPEFRHAGDQIQGTRQFRGNRHHADATA